MFKWRHLIALLGLVESAPSQTNPTPLFGVTQVWKYQQTSILDGVNWISPTFDDAAWPSGPALLYVESSPLVTPRNTPLNSGRNTYYFRTRFPFTNATSGASLVFSNLIDDGAVVYLNGVEVQRVRMPAAPTPIVYATSATASPLPFGDATAYEVFTLSGDLMTNLVRGDNVLAAEVHQRPSGGEADIVWGTAVSWLAYTGALMFVTHPASVSVVDGRPAGFIARAVADPDPAYQWFKDGVAIPGATNRAYSLSAAYPWHGGTYFLQASNAHGTLVSSNAVLSVLGDYDPPVPLSATGAKDLVTISISFTESPDAAAATDTTRFRVLPDGPGSGPVQILSATLVPPTNVVLTTTPRIERADYVVRVEGVHDFSSRSNAVREELPLRAIVDLVATDEGTLWRYDDSGAEPAPGWAQPAFDDSSWSNGPAVLYAGTAPGALPSPVRTTLALTHRSSAERVIAYYFRLRWDFPGEPARAALRLRHIVDDGAIFHLNGAEMHSVRMPVVRPLFSSNLAVGAINLPAYEPTINQPGTSLAISNVVRGQNVLAVQVHQGATNSSDVALAAELEATIERFVAPVRLGVPETISERAGTVVNGGTLGIDNPLPTNLVVTLVSSDSSMVTVPGVMVIPAGATSASFDLTVRDDALLNGPRSAVVSARAPGHSTARASVRVLDDEFALVQWIMPDTLTEGTAATAMLVLDRAPTFAAVLGLASTHPALVVPASVTISPGSTSSTFQILAPEDSVLNGTRPATVVIEFPGWPSEARLVTVVDDESTDLQLTLPATFTENDGLRINAGQVALLGLAASNTVVTLTSARPMELSVPASVTIPAGQSNVSFDVTLLDDANTNGTRSITVTASADGFVPAETLVTLYDEDPALVAFSHIASPRYAGNGFLVALAVQDLSGRPLTQFAGSLALHAASPTGAVAVLPPSIGPFTNGRWNGVVTVPAPATAVRLSCSPLGNSSDPFHVERWAVRTHTFPAQQIAYSALTGLIYGSVPSYAASQPNTITAFDPVGGTNVWSLPVGDIIRPGFQVLFRSGRLALADDDRHLFVAVSNAATVRRVDVVNRTITSTFHPSGLSVVDLTPLAGSSTALAVSLGDAQGYGGVAIYDQGVPRPTIAPYGATLLKPGLNAETLYGFSFSSSEFYFGRLAVTGSGAAVLDSTPGLFTDYYNGIAQEGGLIFAASGQVVDPTNRVVLARLAPGGGRIHPDPTSGRIFIAGYAGTNYFIQPHDARTYLPLKPFLIPAGAGEIIGLVRYGTNGLAMHTYWDSLYLIESPSLFPGGTPADLQLAQTQTPDPPVVGSNVTFSVLVTNAGPADALETTLTDVLPANSLFVAASVSRGFWTNESGVIRAELGYLPAGATASFTLTVRPTLGGPMTNRAFVIANETDSNLFDNVATHVRYVRFNLAHDASAAIPLTTRDIVFDPVTDRIYASIPGSVPELGNRLLPVDPGTGVLDNGWFVGNEPGQLALIPPGGRLYATAQTNLLLNRVHLGSRLTELSFALHSNAPPPAYTVGDLAVLPGTPGALGVLRRQSGANWEIAVYDDGVPRPQVAAAAGGYNSDSLTAGSDGASLYLQAWAGLDFHHLAVAAEGVRTLYVDPTITPPSWTRRWIAVEHLLFGSDGVVIDPAAPRFVAQVPVQGTLGNAVACYDARRARVFYLVQSNAWALHAFDARTLAPLQSLVISNVLGIPSSLVRVREDGFAFRTDAGRLYGVRATTAGHGSPADLAVSAQSSHSRLFLGDNMTITVTATNQGPNLASNVVLSLHLAAAASVVNASAPYVAYSTGQPGLRFNLGYFANGASTNITVVLRATAAGDGRAVTAVNGNAEDANQTNNTAAMEWLTVLPPDWTGVQFLPWPVRDFTYDAARNVFHLSSGSETVLVVSAETGEVLSSLLAGPQTGRVKITDNADFLYVTVSNGAAIARLRLADGVRDRLFDLGLNLLGRPYAVTDFEPVPGAPHSVVVGKTHPSHAYRAVTLYEDGVGRPLSPQDEFGVEYLEFAGLPNRVYASTRGGAFRRFRTLELGPDGIQEPTAQQDIPPTLFDIEYAGGFFHATSGELLTPTGTVVARIGGLAGGTLVEPDPGQSRVHYLAPFSGPAGTVWRLLAYEPGGSSLLGTLSLSNVLGTPLNLVNWGTNRLAFNTTSNRLYLAKVDAAVQFTSTLSNPVAVAHQPIALQWRLTNAGPAATAVHVSNPVPNYAGFGGGSAVHGALFPTNASFVWVLTNLVPNSSSLATVELVFTNSTDVFVTNTAVASVALSDPQDAILATTTFRVLADNDLDGLGDSWEHGNFGHTGVAPSADADGDGLSNGQEFTQGTDPNDAANTLRIGRFLSNGQMVSLTFFAPRGQRFAVDKAQAIIGPWTESVALLGDSQPVTWTDAIGAAPAFYRVRRLF